MFKVAFVFCLVECMMENFGLFDTGLLRYSSGTEMVLVWAWSSFSSLFYWIEQLLCSLSIEA